MPFTGTPVIKQVTDNLIRITGIHLPGDEGGTGTIGLFQNTGTPEIRLPQAFKPESARGAEDQLVSLQDAISVLVNYVTTGFQVTQVKTGTTPSDFLITLIEPFGGASSDLEIYVRFT